MIRYARDRMAWARTSRLWVACGVVLAALAAPPAAAQTARAEALEAFQHGVAEMETEDWNLALGDLERSYELYPTQVALWDIAVCLEALQRFAEANARLRRFLVDYGAVADETRLREVNDMIERLAHSIGRVRLNVDVDGAEVRVDGRLVGSSPLARPLELDAGRHEIAASRLGRGSDVADVAVTGGQIRTVNLHLIPPPPRTTRARAPVRHAARTRRAIVHGPAARTMDVELGLALASRHMSVEVSGSPKPRTFSAPAYPELALDLQVFPLAILETGPPLVTGIGVFGRFRRHLYLTTSGTTAMGETIDLAASEQELLLGLTWRAPLTRGAQGPVLVSSLGYGYFAFQFDPVQMSLLGTEVQMPGMVYDNFVSDLALEVPGLPLGLTLELGLQYRYVTDVGQDARDLFGADSQGGWAYGGRIGFGVVPVLDVLRFWARIEYTVFEMEFSGPSSWEGGGIGGFPSGTDRYVRFTLAFAYVREEPTSR